MTSAGNWLSKAAVRWALDEAPDVPAHLVAALVAVARYADEHGRGAHPSAYTLSLIIRKTERSTKKDLAQLRKLGLIVPGDQRIVADMRPDKRPSVYDLAMERGVAQDTPSGPSGVSHRTPRQTGAGCRRGVERGVVEVSSGVSHRTPKEFLKNSGTRGRGNGAAAPPRPLADKPVAAPPCPECGAAFSQEQLADPAFAISARAGTAICRECTKPRGRHARAASA